MKNPQTLAEELYKHFPDKKLKAIKDYACCAFTLIWFLGLDPSDIDAIMLVSDLMNEKALDEECTVYWADCIKKITGREIEHFEKKNISSIRNIKEKTIVKYMRGKVGHWVGVTICHETRTKVTGADVLMKPAAPGTGIIAGGTVRSIIGLTGVKNLISKSLGSSNKVNVAYAVIEALKQQTPRKDWVGAKAEKKAAKTEEKPAPTKKEAAKPAPKKAPAKKPAAKKSTAKKEDK